MRKIFVRQYCPFPAMRGLSIGYLSPHPSPLAPPEPVIHGSGFLTWQIDGEARPLPGLRGDIYGSVMAVNDGSGEHEADARFPDECELLRPIVAGAGILYVVDGSKPYGAESELEMQILQWTGRPRMALINLIGEEDHQAEWRQALDQYFSLVRVFDAVGADFDRMTFAEKLDLLILSSNSNKTVEMVRIDLISKVSIDGSPYLGKADAAVTIAVFDDYQ